MSNLLRFAVSSLAEIAEQEPNEPGAPQKVTLPATLVGTLGTAGDVDAYEFTRARGRGDGLPGGRPPARRRASTASSVCSTRTGSVVAENNDVDLSRDSVLTWRFTETGTYTLTIEDVEHGGGENGFAYRIYAGALPYVTGVFPLGVPAGASADVAVTGVNLGDRTTLRVDGRSPALVGGTIPIPASRPARGFRASTGRAVALGAYPEALEAEPNDEPAVAQTLAIPVDGERADLDTASGSRRGAAARDQDLFRFTARKGQKLVFDVTAQQLGSPLDSIDRGAGRRRARRAARRDPVRRADRDRAQRSRTRTAAASVFATWNELGINDYLLIGDELLQVASMPTHPDDDVQLMSYRGGRLDAARHVAAQPLGRRGGATRSRFTRPARASSPTACRRFRSTTSTTMAGRDSAGRTRGCTSKRRPTATTSSACGTCAVSTESDSRIA